MGVLVLLASGVDIWRAQGTEMWQTDDKGAYAEIGEHWSWSTTKHYHYLVQTIDNPPGGYWVPASTHPPAFMKKWWTPIEGTYPLGNNPLNIDSREYRPTGTFIWIPRSFMSKGHQNHFVLGDRSNYVVCKESAPTAYPPKDISKKNGAMEKKESKSNSKFKEAVIVMPPERSSSSNSPSRSPSSGATSMDLD